jgi:aminoglycoside 6'-N-acetyltransferase I
MTHVRAAEPRDLNEWIRMRVALWPDDIEEHRAAAERFFAGVRHEPVEVRCSTDRVAYLEGWYVEPSLRRHGVGAALIAAAERWGVEQGCTEFGSDSLIDNEASRQAHRALGFEETGRVVNFRKDLSSR